MGATRRMVDHAREFAIRAHEDQRYGDSPFVQHLDDVAAIVRAHGFFHEVVAYLHETLNDTAADEEDLRREFGDPVARQVAFLTEPPAKNRRARKDEFFRRLAGAGEEYWPALVVKAAERLANVRASLQDENASMVGMYVRAYRPFRDAVYRPGLAEPIWVELDSLMEIPYAL